MTSSSSDELLLAGDIGGTKANLVLVAPTGDPRQPVFAEHLDMRGVPSLEALLQGFIQRSGRRPSHLCVGIPSPVIDGTVAPSNLPWTANETQIARQFGFEHARFLNDLVATASGIPELSETEHVVLQAGEARPQGVIAVVAPGTGLGMAYLVHDGGRYRALPSEGGHADFAPRGEQQCRLQKFLANDAGQTYLESVCSGKGISALWRFLGTEKLRDAPTQESAIAQALAAAQDATPLVMAGATDAVANPRSAAAADLFATILLQEAGNTALRMLATGGVMLAGGVPPRVLDRLRTPAALAAFCSSPRMSALLARIPVSVVTNDRCAVLGAVAVGRTLME